MEPAGDNQCNIYHIDIKYLFRYLNICQSTDGDEGVIVDLSCMSIISAFLATATVLLPAPLHISDLGIFLMTPSQYSVLKASPVAHCAI